MPVVRQNVDNYQQLLTIRKPLTTALRVSRANMPMASSEQAYAQAWRSLRGETLPPWPECSDYVEK